jgi:F0F1-type ATP synthase assembly protein I
MSEKPFYSQVRQLGLVTTVPAILLGGPLVGFFLGGWLDRKAHCYPWLTVLFIFFGFAASGIEIAKILREVSSEDKKSDEEHKS